MHSFLNNFNTHKCYTLQWRFILKAVFLGHPVFITETLSYKNNDLIVANGSNTCYYIIKLITDATI